VFDIMQTAPDGVTVLAHFVYTYDAVGNPKTMTSLADTETYTYDAANRLTKVCYTVACTEPGSFIQYMYDGVGNRRSETRGTEVTTYTYDADDQLREVIDAANVITVYDYDAVGNEIQAGATQYAYDLASRLIGAVTHKGNWTYTYDGNGRRLTMGR